MMMKERMECLLSIILCFLLVCRGSVVSGEGEDQCNLELLMQKMWSCLYLYTQNIRYWMNRTSTPSGRYHLCCGFVQFGHCCLRAVRQVDCSRPGYHLTSQFLRGASRQLTRRGISCDPNFRCLNGKAGKMRPCSWFVIIWSLVALIGTRTMIMA